MKKIIAVVLVLICLISIFAGCDAREAQKVSYNVSLEADNFNVMRHFVAINARTDKPIMEIIGRMSIERDSDNDLNIIVEVGDGKYKKNMIGMNEWVIWSVDDISGAYADPYHYEINFQPEAIIPITITNID